MTVAIDKADVRVTAPELDGCLAWLNTDRALSMKELRGSIVILDFWTYCCINCMHVVPTLREIESRFRDEPVTVIGVHSGKFNAERDPLRIREAMGRYQVDHPVAVDDDMRIWSNYAIRSWPTLVIISADGKIAAVAPGEPDLEQLDAFIRRELQLARDHKTLGRPARIAPGKRIDNEPLLYPGKACVLPNGRIAVSDSGHHRVIVCAPDGVVEVVAGSGIRGHADGPCATAAFDDPQGLCWHQGALYVADTRNHAVRRIDLDDKQVSTVAGTGRLGVDIIAPGAECRARTTALRSPWDVCSYDDAIFVAMAGSHQIWRLWPERDRIEVYAGTGTEALIDGPVAHSAWAQPSGLSARDGVLFVADSESSAVRAIDLQKHVVHTLVGQGLFDFGDGEGDADAVLLQHCLGVAAIEGGVLIADTYNGKLKRWRGNIAGVGEITTLLDGLSEPGGVAVSDDGMIVVPDTNAHAILGVREGAVARLSIQGIPRAQRGAMAPKSSDRLPTSAARGWFTQLLELESGVGLAPGDARVWLDLATPGGTALSPGSPLALSVEVSRRSDLVMLHHPQFSADANGGRLQRLAIDLRVSELPSSQIESELIVRIDYVACKEADTARCSPERVNARLPIRLLQAGTNEIAFALDLQGIEEDGRQ